MAAVELVIGVTGSISSGCTTIAEYLKQKGFYYVRLSDFIREELKARGKKLTAKNLQDCGDELRIANGNQHLAVRAVHKYQSEARNNEVGLVIDGIRNPGEVSHLKSNPNFFLISSDASFAERLERYRKMLPQRKRISDTDFEKIDLRDSGRDQPENGQNVTMCSDLADFQIMNDKSWVGEAPVKEQLHQKIDEFLLLIKDPGSRPPLMREIGMHLAYSTSCLSECLKRRVGATITAPGPGQTEFVVATGYNRPPGGHTPCKIRYKECYRDAKKKEFWQGLGRIGLGGKTIDKIQKAMTTNFKNLDYCNALHAEESAILQVAALGGVSIAQTVLYTTTFPCLLCAKKVVEVGIGGVVYNETYPVGEAKELLENSLGKDQVVRFEGVKPLAFFRLFHRVNP